MFRQVVLSTTKSKLPAPYSSGSMVHREAGPSKSYMTEEEMLYERSWRTRKSMSRSISLEHLKEDSPKADAVMGSSGKPRPKTARVPSYREREGRPKSHRDEKRKEGPGLVPLVQVSDHERV